jgi:hypothetical protein
MGNRIILTEIFNAYGGWKYDDRNNTDFPIATTSLVASQTNYSLPTDTTEIHAVYVQNELDDQWNLIEPVTLQEINRVEAEPSFNDTPANPTYYRLVNNSVFLYPPANYTKAGGLRIEYSRDVSTFATTDTTKTPGFEPIFHELIAVYMASQFADINQLPMRDEMRKRWEDGLARVRRHFSQKFRNMYPVRVKIKNTINNYI